MLHNAVSPQPLSEKEHRSLLIQFLLFEMFEALRAADAGRWDLLLTAEPRFFPYDWSATTGFMNKIAAHGALLKNSFPDQKRVVKNFEKTLAKELSTLHKMKKPSKEPFEAALSKLYMCLEPLIVCCKEDENLIFFLLKHCKEIDRLMQEGHLQKFMHTIHPCGLESLGEKMCDQYHQRGFFSQISEFKLLLTELLHA